MKGKLAIFAVVIIIAVIVSYTYLSSQTQIQDRITVSGAFALYPMMIKWAEEFQKIHPQVKIEVSAGGAGKGMTDALAGLVDIGMVSRDISPEETAQGAFWVGVVKDAVVATINKNNPLLQDILSKGFNKSTFMGIYIYGNITTWGQTVGKTGMTETINVYTRSDSCGAADVWAKYMGHKQEDLRGIAVYGDPGLAEAVKNDAFAIGYNNVGYAYDANTTKPVEGLAIVPIDTNENGIVDANESYYATRAEVIDAIATGLYPSPPSRLENLVTKDNFKGIVKDFMKWILTDGQQFAIDAGYVPLPTDIQQQMLAKVG